MASSSSQPCLREFIHRGITYKNRLGLSPLTRGRAGYPDGVPNHLHVEYYSQRSSGGFILTEVCCCFCFFFFFCLLYNCFVLLFCFFFCFFFAFFLLFFFLCFVMFLFILFFHFFFLIRRLESPGEDWVGSKPQESTQMTKSRDGRK